MVQVVVYATTVNDSLLHSSKVSNFVIRSKVNKLYNMFNKQLYLLFIKRKHFTTNKTKNI